MTMPRTQARLSLVMIGFLVLTACAPTQSAGGGEQPAGPVPEKEKTLTAMIQREPGSFDIEMTSDRGSSRAGGVNHLGAIAKAELSRVDESGARIPQLAVDIPSQAKGSVVLNPDSTMDVTWKLRPDIYWHDGAPITTADFVFRETAITELQIIGNRPPITFTVSAPDPRTLVVRWAGPYVNFHEGGVSVLPKHILGDLYAQDKDALPRSRYFRGDFVGTGPFKVVEWADGSHIEFRRHEQYALGVPPIHRLFLKFVPDTNVMVANLLSANVDVALPEGIDLPKAIELRDRWAREGTGHQVKGYITTALYYLEIMVDPQYARPVNAWPQVPVRQALYHALDRPTLDHVINGDLGMVADSFYAPNDRYYPLVKDVMPQYPYDPRKAQLLLEQAGWTMGSDGVRVHPSGERFDIHFMLFPGQQHFTLGSIIQSNWKDVGVNTELESLTPANQTDVKYTSTRSGLFTSNPGASAFYTSRLHSRGIPTEANRYSGSNRGHFRNPVVDDIYEKLAITIDPTQQQVLHRAILAEIMGKAVMYPLYWESVPIISLKGVTGPKIIGSVATVNVNEWDKN